MGSTKRIFSLLTLILLLAACQSPPPAAEVDLPALFSDHMVLQQELPVPVWGTATPGGTVTVEFNGQKVRAVADADGNWSVCLQPTPAGGPYQMQVSGATTHTIDDILVGEVWLGSGQSNMEMPLAGWGQVQDYEQEIAAADYPRLRLFTVQRVMSPMPLKSVPSDGWAVCQPEQIAEFSSTAYFFGRELLRELDTPIGLIHSSWGGTIIEAWIGAGTLKTIPGYKEQLDRLAATWERFRDVELAPGHTVFDLIAAEYQAEIHQRDRGLNDPQGPWYTPGTDAGQWPTMDLPVTWENAGLPGLDGIVWFHKTVDLPAAWAGHEITVHLSAVDDIDSTYFNGELVGGYDVWDAPRAYPVPGRQVHGGTNEITVRVRDNQGGGGIWGDPSLLKLTCGDQTLSLAGPWQYQVGLRLDELTSVALSPYNPNLPTILSNAMIEPLVPYALRGVIWYQGEANTGQAYQYRELFPALIRDWRTRWGQGNFPFLFVQLANFMAALPEPAEDSWAELREAQLMTLTEPNTGMAVTIDIGNADDIHPKNKQEVGRRLALNALKITYGRDLLAAGPLYESAATEGDRIRLHFTNVGTGLQTPDGAPLTGFAIAGADRHFRWATAQIDDGTVVVSHPQIHQPVAVRYGWASNPSCNLYNSAGLPASPFRTDDWPGITQP